ncbi:MAG: hypothetical protein DIU60_009820, partial [Actinomycetes bacterium]
MAVLSRVLARFAALVVPLAPVVAATPPASPGPAAHAAARASAGAAPPHYARSQDDRRAGEEAAPASVHRADVDLTRARAQWIDRATVA